MPSQKNIHALEELKTNLERSKTFILADYKGLNVAQLTKLRLEVAKAGGEVKINKNTLVKLALEAGKYPVKEVASQLTGPTATVFSYDDEVSVVKILYNFGKETGLPKFKAGFLGQVFLSAARLEQLGNLPEKPILQAQLVGTLAAPLVGLVNVLQGNFRKLVYVLKAIEKSRN